MEFNQFVNEVKGGIKQFLPIEYEDAQVRIEEVKKLNENYLGITDLSSKVCKFFYFLSAVRS